MCVGTYSIYYSFSTNIIIYCNILNANKTYNWMTSSIQIIYLI